MEAVKKIFNILNKDYILVTRSWAYRGMDLAIPFLSGIIFFLFLHVGYFNSAWICLAR